MASSGDLTVTSSQPALVRDHLAAPLDLLDQEVVPERGDPLVLTPFVDPIEGLAGRREHLDHHGRIGEAVVVGGERPAGHQNIGAHDCALGHDLEVAEIGASCTLRSGSLSATAMCP